VKDRYCFPHLIIKISMKLMFLQRQNNYHCWIFVRWAVDIYCTYISLFDTWAAQNSKRQKQHLWYCVKIQIQNNIMLGIHVCCLLRVFLFIYLFMVFILVIIPCGRKTYCSTVTHKTHNKKCDKKAQLTLSNPRDVKACQNCNNSTCFVSFHRIPFPWISKFRPRPI